MLKERHKQIVFFRIVLDFILTVFSWLLAYYVRFKVMGGGQANLGSYFLQLSPVVAIITIYVFFRKGLYNSQRLVSWQKEMFTVILAILEAFVITVVCFYFFAGNKVSRISLILFVEFQFVTLLVERIIVRNILYKIRKSGRNLRKILAIGYGTRMEEYITKINELKDTGIRVTGRLENLSGNELSEYLKDKSFDLIVISYPDEDMEIERGVLKRCYNQLIPIFVISNMPYSIIGANIIDFKGIPVLELNQPSIGLFSSIIKRLTDIIGALIGLALFSPLLIVISIIVKVTSRGPVFYGQERMTRDGKVFKMWKFRSMKVGSDKVGSGWTVENDPRRTAIGPFLRSTSIDELPQLWNVLMGEMSLVGPRPERPIFIDKFNEEIPGYMLRHKVKTGITGWAQVNGWRGDTSIPKRIECDIYYIKNWNFFLDIKILLLTFIKGFINKNAY